MFGTHSRANTLQSQDTQTKERGVGLSCRRKKKCYRSTIQKVSVQVYLLVTNGPGHNPWKLCVHCHERVLLHHLKENSVGILKKESQERSRTHGDGQESFSRPVDSLPPLEFKNSWRITFRMFTISSSKLSRQTSRISTILPFGALKAPAPLFFRAPFCERHGPNVIEIVGCMLLSNRCIRTSVIQQTLTILPCLERLAETTPTKTRLMKGHVGLKLQHGCEGR